MSAQIFSKQIISPDLDQAVATTLPVPIRALTKHLEPDTLGEVMRRIFDDLARFLDYLRLIETDVRQNCWLKQIPSIFMLVHKEALALLDFIENRALTMEGLSEAVRAALDSTSYAINHELRRVFGSNLPEQSALEQTLLSRGKIEDAYGLLHNCFQESMIVLAQVFEPALDGARLFNDTQTRLKESLVLCKDLSALIQLVKDAEKGHDQSAINVVIERLEEFRAGSLRYLMYKDWEPCERMIEEFKASRGTSEIGQVLHRTGCYFEMLLGHVRMRAVLAKSSLQLL